MRCRRLAACQTTHCYLNHPFEPGLYRRAPFKKVLGTFSGIDWLGEGFHHVRAPMQPSGFSYIHLHFRPYDEFRARAAAKIVAHGYELGEPALREYVASRANCHHAAAEYLMSREEYEVSFDKLRYSEWPMLKAWFESKLGRFPFGLTLTSTATFG